MTTLIFAIIGATGFGFWFWKRGILLIAEKKATKILDLLLFDNNETKEDILNRMNNITKKKYSKDQLLDYFLKIKGLQAINKQDGIDFWTRKYVTSPTRLKLNYFEQVKFYETFLNFPSSKEQTQNTETEDNTYITSESNEVFLNKKQLA